MHFETNLTAAIGKISPYRRLSIFIAILVSAIAIAGCSTAESPEYANLEDSGVWDEGNRGEATEEPECGNLKCDGEETCVECPIDCGQCPTCDWAPTCTGAHSIPIGSEPIEEFGNESQVIWSSGVDLGPTADETDCLDAKLRMRLRQIRIHKNGADLIDVDLYCIITANEGDKGSEIYMTPLSYKVGDGDAPLLFDVGKSKFWGQLDLRPTNMNLSIDYRCYRSKDNRQYEEVLDKIAKAAKDVGGVAGQYGWAFGVGSLGVSIVSKAVGADSGDELWLHLQQTISKDALLEMTNGVIWSVRQTGRGASLIEDYDWELELEAWGCADARPWQPPV